jgi:hypothetical protein
MLLHSHHAWCRVDPYFPAYTSIQLFYMFFLLFLLRYIRLHSHPETISLNGLPQLFLASLGGYYSIHTPLDYAWCNFILARHLFCSHFHITWSSMDCSSNCCACMHGCTCMTKSERWCQLQWCMRECRHVDKKFLLVIFWGSDQQLV